MLFCLSACVRSLDLLFAIPVSVSILFLFPFCSRLIVPVSFRFCPCFGFGLVSFPCYVSAMFRDRVTLPHSPAPSKRGAAGRIWGLNAIVGASPLFCCAAGNVGPRALRILRKGRRPNICANQAAVPTFCKRWPGSPIHRKTLNRVLVPTFPAAWPHQGAAPTFPFWGAKCRGVHPPQKTCDR